MKKHKIIVLGPNGMLGQMATTYFRRAGYEVQPIYDRYTLEERETFMARLAEAGPGWVLNCIGKIKQKTSAPHDLYTVNTLLPLDVANCLNDDQFLIHPSTDCVFEGDAGRPYDVTDKPDARDDYGWSKRLAEVGLQGHPQTLVIRVSIIGPDQQLNAKGLLGWFLGLEPNSTINGYLNHYWNGITTLEWCKQVALLIETSKTSVLAGKLLQLAASDSCSKFQLLQWINEIYKKNITILPFNTEKGVDRRLIGEWPVKPLQEQLEELRQFG